MIYDINLLPNNKRNESNKIGFYMVLIGILCAVVVGIFFYFIPSQKKQALNNEIQAQEEKIASYADVEEEFNTLTDSVNKLNNTITVLEKLKASKTETSTWMNELEQSVPPKAKITSMVSKDGLLTIIGTCSTYREMAQFVVNLRAIEGVESVTFTNAVEQEDSTSENTTPQNYEFTINVRYTYSDIISDLQAEETAAAAQEEEENEAD